MAMTPEGRVKHGVKKILKEEGIWYFMPVSNGMGQVGIPDFICCRPVTITQDMVGATIGAFMAVETKAPGKINDLTANQTRVIGEITKHYGYTYVVDNADYLKPLLKGIL